MVFNATYFSYIVAVSFLGGGNRRTQRKPPTYSYHKQLTNENKYTICYSSISWSDYYCDSCNCAILWILPWCIALVSAATQRCSEDPRQARYIWFQDKQQWNVNVYLVKGLVYLTPLPIIFQLYRASQFYYCRRSEDPEKPIDLSQVIDKLYHIML